MLKEHKMQESIIKFESVEKFFKVNFEKNLTFQEMIVSFPKFLKKKNSQVYNVFTDLNFSIFKGDFVGITGPNGCGKSTILKLICNILKPNQGRIFVKGKISPLLELGAGFHPELTGRENVFLYGAILGMKKREIQKHFLKMVDFSEIGKFIDTKIKYYSSGMVMRLAFSVAIHVDYDILIADEVLAVGDENFQKKCILEIMNSYRNHKTILFVSHDINLINSMCNKILYVDRDKIQLINNLRF